MSHFEGRVSDLHQDIELPQRKATEPDYEQLDWPPQRYADIGPEEQHAVIYRLEQFGVSRQDLTAIGVERASDLTDEQYFALVGEAMRHQYDVVFANVFAHWEQHNREEYFTIIEQVAEQYQQWGFNLVTRGSDVEIIGPDDVPNMVISLEGGLHVQGPEDIQKIFDAGVRSMIIQYSRENDLASKTELTPTGQAVVKKMFSLGMIVDVAHMMPGPRQQVFSLAEAQGQGAQVGYTHGAPVDQIARLKGLEHIAAERGLSYQEIGRIAKMGGIVGLSVSKPFFKDIEGLTTAIDRTMQLDNGPRTVAIGSDWGGVPNEWRLDGIPNATEMRMAIGNALVGRFGYTEAHIDALMRSNAHDWVARALDHQE